jgi:hypothetical protein
MCDYSLQSVLSRPAKVGDKLTTRNFGTGTRGFATSDSPTVAVCVLPGTELAFSSEVKFQQSASSPGGGEQPGTRPRSSDKSVRTSRGRTMMRSSFRTGRLFS